MSRRSVLVAVLGAFVVIVVIAFALAGVRERSSSGEVGTAAPAIGRSLGADGAGYVAPETGYVAPDTAAAAPPAPAQGTTTVDRSLVRTAQVVMEVPDAAVAVREVRAAATAAGGIVTQEQSGAAGGWLELRVPADALDRTVEQMAGIGDVLDRSSSVLDATEEVVDLDARVISQRASVERIRALLAQAETIGDVVAIESELATREAELDSLTARLTTLRDQVATSTLTVDLRVPGGSSGPVDDPPDFLAGIAAGWAGLQILGAAVGFVIPFLPLLGAVAVGWWLWRRRRTVPATVGPQAT